LHIYQLLSLEEAVKIDRELQESIGRSPQDSFSERLFRQPSLVEGPLKPAMYRKHTQSASPHCNSGVSNNINDFYSVFSGTSALCEARDSFLDSPVDVEANETQRKVIESNSNSTEREGLMLDGNDSEAMEEQIDQLLDNNSSSLITSAIRGRFSNNDSGTFRGSIESTTYGMMFMEKLRKSKGGPTNTTTVLKEPLVDN